MPTASNLQSGPARPLLPPRSQRSHGLLRQAALLGALGGLLAVGCGEPEPQYLPPLPDMASGSVNPGVPCGVSKLIADHCVVCHGQPPAAAPISLVGYETLTAKSLRDSAKSVAERALLRMQDGSDPMPPGPTVTVPQAELAPLQAWIAAGTPMTQCQNK